MSNGLQTRIEDLKARFERLSARERQMVGALAAFVGLSVIFGVGYWITAGLDEVRERNEEIRKALHDIEKHQQAYLEQRKRIAAFEVRMAHNPLELNSYVEKAASAVGVTIAESGEVSPAPADRFTQRGVEIKLNKVTIGQLASLLKKIEGDQAHIVQITRLNVNTRWNRNQELDVELVVTTYDRNTAQPSKSSRSGRKG